MKKASDKWYFTKETNAKGLCYIYAYQTQWDPVTKNLQVVKRSLKAQKRSRHFS